jgi:hypothetical protein
MPRLRPVHKLSLAGEILGAYLRVRWLLRTRELHNAVASLRRSSGRSGRLYLDAPRDGERLGDAVVRTLRLLPTDSRCLMRSLVLLRLLVRRGTAGTLIIAVRPNDDADGLYAHAWVELDGRPLLAPATEEYGRLLTL